MKKYLLLLALACLASHAFAQFNFGFTAGVNQSHWTWNDKSVNQSVDYKPVIGWRAAIGSEWQWKPSVALRAEFGAQVKANKVVRRVLLESDILEGNFDGTLWTFSEHYQYLEGSMLCQISPIKKVRQFYLLAGGTVGYMTSAWLTTKGSEASSKFSRKSSIDLSNPNVNRNLFALDFGLGGNIPLGTNGQIKVETRYQHNLLNLASNDDVDASVYSLIFNLGYFHRL